ncbi:MAG TPA: SMP-30/gluconolactonase/LRE family protein [Steroidobacteraceae bacterium]
MIRITEPPDSLTLVVVISAFLLAGCPSASLSRAEPAFPVKPELFLDVFRASEGLTFNGEGKLFIGANTEIWIVEKDGSHRQIADVDTHLGQAGIGERDILAADFGPTNMFRDGPNDDGIIWRISPEGVKTVVARGIADPNFILVLEDGTFLVSDDGTDKIYLVDHEGNVSIWSDAIDYPNGLALSPDGSTLYVAQIFTRLQPEIGFSDYLWALPVKDGRPAGEPKLVARTGFGGVDGLAMDILGRVYIADNGGGKIFRYDPKIDELILIADGMPAIASLVFGEGDFDHESLYGTSTFRGGGKIWKVKVGTRGIPQYRGEAKREK